MLDLQAPAHASPAPPGEAARLAPAWPPSWRPSRSLLAVAAIAVVAIAVSFPPVQHPRQPVKLFPDSDTYLTWTLGRPPTPWLFYALVGQGWAVCIAQTILSVVCWTVFGWSVLGVPGALCTAALAITQPVALWNFTVLSEPLTLSFAAALLAATIVLGRHWTPARAAAWAACALLFAGVRVENFVAVPFLCAALLAAHPARWRWIASVGIATAAMFLVFGVVLDKESKNWQIRMTNVVLTRILPDHDLGPEFQARGLPVDATLLKYRGQMLKYYDVGFRADTPAFQKWLDEESRGTYLRWLATAAPHRLLAGWMNIVVKPIDDPYYIAGVRLPPIGALLNPAYAAAALPFRAWLYLAAVPLACAALSRRLRFADLFALAYLAAVYAMTFAAFHGDTGELPRHMILAATLYRLAPVVVLASIWDRLAPAMGDTAVPTAGARSAPPSPAARP